MAAIAPCGGLTRHVANPWGTFTLATNLANASTQGYHAIRPVFHEVMARQNSSFSAVRQSGVDNSMGSLKETGNPLDLALPKDTFLQVETPAGVRYTRASSLKLAPNGVLTTQTGFAVHNDAGQRIEAAADALLSIEKDGSVKDGDEELGFLRVVTFADPRQMTYEGQGLLVPNAEAGAPVLSNEPIEIGKIEESNASPVRAMTELMMASRMFEAMQRAISTFRSTDSRLVRTVPK